MRLSNISDHPSIITNSFAPVTYKLWLFRTCGGKPRFWQLGMGNCEWGIPYTASVSLD
jgi:hypothetical protein